MKKILLTTVLISAIASSAFAGSRDYGDEQQPVTGFSDIFATADDLGLESFVATFSVNGMGNGKKAFKNALEETLKENGWSGTIKNIKTTGKYSSINLVRVDTSGEGRYTVYCSMGYPGYSNCSESKDDSVSASYEVANPFG